jgi:hypothetical protein
MIGLIIGKGGETINRLCLESGARIEIAQASAEPCDMRNIVLSGTLEQVQQAKMLIDSMVSSWENNRKPG